MLYYPTHRTHYLCFISKKYFLKFKDTSKTPVRVHVEHRVVINVEYLKYLLPVIKIDNLQSSLGKASINI